MFRPAIRPLFLSFIAVAFPIFLLLVLLDDGLHPDWTALSVATIAMALCTLLSAWALQRLFPVRISADGILGHSIWGFRRFVRWEHIAVARPFRILNLHYLRLYSATERTVTWLPLFPTEPHAFYTAIRSAMPPDSPVSAYIDNA